MKKIILASKSAQRKKLLKLAGLQFTVRPSHAPEDSSIKTTCEALIKQNALAKAKEVASSCPSGLVIGADTVVFDGKKTIIEKPTSLKEARQILKRLYSKPHWVYTGVVVFDAKTSRCLKGCEKTKVFMQPLSEEEMRHYHRHTNPLDKAGGFDIEGWGGLFISRIEGCYSNVIGLPMARLRIMLKKMGVKLL